MLAVISPAKTLDYETPTPAHRVTPLLFPESAATLVDTMRHYSPADLQALMGISGRLAQQNAERFSTWQWPFAEGTARAAAFAFKGDVYAGLDAYSMNAEQLEYVEKHLRILSGLYGLLRPTDGMLPYRLEMGKKVATNGADDLYEFWGDQIARQVQSDLEASGEPTLINLASNEYFKSIVSHLKDTRVITPVFKDWKNGKYKIISFYAKKARGLMVRYMADNAISDPEQIKAFDKEGYGYDPELSSNDEWVFLRRQDA